MLLNEFHPPIRQKSRARQGAAAIHWNSFGSRQILAAMAAEGSFGVLANRQVHYAHRIDRRSRTAERIQELAPSAEDARVSELKPPRHREDQ